MAYIGRGLDKISNIEKLDVITFDGSQSYTLQKNSTNFVPVSANNLIVSIDGVVQAGNFTVSGSTIDFGVAVASTSTCDFIMHFGTGVTTQPSDGSVTDAKLAASAINSQSAITSLAEDDEVLLYDTSATALKKITAANFNKGSRVLLSTANASSDATIVFDNTVITDTYEIYELIYTNVTNATDNQAIIGQFSTDNGSNYLGGTGYHDTHTCLISSDTNSTYTSRNSTGRDTFVLFGHEQGGSNVSGEVAHGRAVFYGLRSTNFKMTDVRTVYTAADGNHMMNTGTSRHNTSSKVNNFKLYAGSGNISSGKFQLFGIRT